MAKKVLIQGPIAKEGIDLLRKEGIVITKLYEHSKEILLTKVRNCDAILSRPTSVEISADVLEQARNLKVIGIHGVGFDNVDMNKASEMGIIVVYTPHANTEAVVEYTIGIILNLTRHILQADKTTRSGQYEKRSIFVGSELKGKKLGVIGLGRIGSKVGRKMVNAFDMKLLGYDPYLSSDQIPSAIELTQDWNQIFKTCDFITIHCPLTEETKGLVSKREFQMMKATAYIINVARGGIVDEKALLQALRNGEIAGAALDVFVEEPLPPNHPLYQIDNLILTPHIAWLTEEARKKMATQAAKGIVDVLAGKEPEYPVNSGILRK